MSSYFVKNDSLHINLSIFTKILTDIFNYFFALIYLMLSNKNVYVLKLTEDGKLTVDHRDDPFKVNSSDEIKNVLILYPEESNSRDISCKIGYFIKNFPLDKSYKVVVDTGKKPEISDYNNFKIDFLINAHEDPFREFETNSKDRFKGVRYIGLNELRSNSYEEVVRMVPRKNKDLEGYILRAVI